MRTKSLILLLITIFTCVSALETRHIVWRVRQVKFIGNKEFSRKELIGLMEQKPKWPLNRVRFSESGLRSDIRSLKSFYINQGFRDIDIKRDTVVFDSSSRQVRIQLSFNEGPRTIVSSIKITPSKGSAVDAIMPVLTTKVQSPLIMPDAIQDARRIEDSLATRGYLAARVAPSFTFDTAMDTVSVDFNAYEGPKIEAGAIRLKGIKSLRPWTITRELTFKQGDTVTLTEIQKSQRRLYRSGLFSFVHIEPVLYDSAGGMVSEDSVAKLPDSSYPIMISVSEADFFRIQTGAGYGSYEGFRISASTSYNNVFGLGHRFTLGGKASLKYQEADLVYSTLWMFMLPLQFDNMAYFNRYDDDKFRGIFEGFKVSFGRQTDFNMAWQAWTDWKYVQWIVAPTDSNRPEGIPERNTQSIGTDISYDTRNDLFSPSQGFYNMFGVKYAGLTPSSNHFIKIQNTSRLYYNFHQKLFFSSALTVGWMRPLGISVATGISADELFYGGGSRSVRGFQDNHLRIFTEGDAVGSARGGNILLSATIMDFRFPIFWWFNGALFADAGYVWNSRAEMGSIEKAVQDIRWTAGPGLRIHTPLAVLRLDVGFKLDRLPDESLYEFHLDIGQPF